MLSKYDGWRSRYSRRRFCAWMRATLAGDPGPRGTGLSWLGSECCPLLDMAAKERRFSRCCRATKPSHHVSERWFQNGKNRSMGPVTLAESNSKHHPAFVPPDVTVSQTWPILHTVPKKTTDLTLPFPTRDNDLILSNMDIIRPSRSSHSQPPSGTLPA
jgi:hypothetical protein